MLYNYTHIQAGFKRNKIAQKLMKNFVVILSLTLEALTIFV